MGLADRFARPGVTSKAAAQDITCLRFEAIPGTRRCRHYLKGGACSLPDEFMCIEWLKANGYAAPESLPPVEETPAPPPPATPPAGDDRDLFGQAVRRPPAPPTEKPRPDAGAPDAEPVPVVRNLTDEDIASFKALGVEVCLATEGCGEIWLVPEYTARGDRQEISVRDAATLAAVCSAFPGARVTRFEKEPARESS